MANSTLDAIRTKVRRLTRKIGEAMLTTPQLDEYINTFVVFDFPLTLRTFNLLETVEFVCNPYQGTYYTDTVNNVINTPLYDFQNRYISVHPPVYVAGYQVLYTQSKEQLFGLYPQLASINQVGTGNGVTTAFAGIIPGGQFPIVPGQVVFSSISTANIGLSVIDIPNTTPFNGIGNLYVPFGEIPGPSVGTINYVTGAYTFIFPAAPAANEPVNSQTVFYQAARPQAVLFYQNQFTLRPIPDQPYSVTLQAYRKPVDLLQANSQPELNEWWQYIAYGAAKKIFEDQMDMESVALIMPEFKRQENMINSRTVVQNTNDRVSTIYSQQTDRLNNAGGWWGYF